MKVGVLGSSGFLGQNVIRVLEDHGVEAVCGGRRYDGVCCVDATKTTSVIRWINNNKLTHVVNLAAVCGGIGFNKKYPFKLWAATTKITVSVLEACVETCINKVVMVGTVCSYSEDNPVPFKESDLMRYGFPEPTNRAYGVSKLNGLIGAQAANQEYGLDIVNLIPVNMYGPYDHFGLENSHVIPALIRKMDEAENVIEIWGDGNPTREFLYAYDCGEAILAALNLSFKVTDLINVGTGQEISIKELVEILSELMNFKGNVIFNEDKPNGQMRRCLDVDRVKKILKWEAKTDFRQGLINTIEWYYDNKEHICI